MFNPSELEGEVDHSFFDSDCGDSNRDGGNKMEKDLKAEKGSPATHERLHKKHTENVKGDLTLRTDVTRQHLKQVENNNSCRGERKEGSRASSVSSVSYISDKVSSNSSDSEYGSDLDSERLNRTFMAKDRGVDDEDAYNQTPNETEEKASAFNDNSQRGNKQSPRSWRTQTPSPTSTESSVDADSESSCNGSIQRSSLGSPTLPKPNKSSLCPGVRRTRVGSSASQDLPVTHTDEPNDTVTDVSPLSSPDTSPLHSLDLNHTESEERSHKEEQQLQQESVPSSGLSNMHQDEDSDQGVDDCSLSLESQLGSKLDFHCPGGRNRKNYSFSNDEVWRIDRENQRLLRALSRFSPGPRRGSTEGKKAHVASKSPLVRLCHSALNRQREQQRIERENLAFLKRLESVKPSPGLRRSEQLADYQRQSGYLGAPSSRSAAKKEKCSSRTPSAGPRSVGFRTSTTTDSSSTPVSRSKKLSAARPAWC